MYQVKLINDNQETIINAVDTSVDAPRITGNIKKGINTIDNFTFNIHPNNPGYNKVNPLKTLVEVLNTKTNRIEYKGRVLLPKHSMGSNGMLSKIVVCEGELGYLLDSTQRYGEYHDVTVIQFLQIIIDNHNRQVSDDKKFTLGEVTVTDSNDSLYRFLGYEKTFDTIKDKLISRLGGEIRVRHKDNIRYLDYVEQFGYTSPTEIRLSKNLKTIEEERDPSEVITRLVPLGAKIKIVNAEGQDVDTEERLTIKSVNNNKDYVDDLDAIAEFGIIEDSITLDDVNFPNILLTRANQYLKSNNKLKSKYGIGALDLSLIGLDIDNIDIYNHYRVVNELMGIDEVLRVIEKTIDIENPHNSNISVGDKFEDIKQYQLSIKRTSDTVKEVNVKINNTINKVNSVESNIVTVGQDINLVKESLTGTNGNIEGVTNILATLSDVVIANKTKIEVIEPEIEFIKQGNQEISVKLETIEPDIEFIKQSNQEISSKLEIIEPELESIKQGNQEINNKLDEILLRLESLEGGM